MGTIKDPKTDGNKHLNIPYYHISSQRFQPMTSVPKSKLAIIVFYDLFAFGLPNTRIIADRLCKQISALDADKQIDVFVPDILLGGGIPEAALGALDKPFPAAKDNHVLNGLGPPKKGLQAQLSRLLAYAGLLRYIPRLWAARESVLGPRCLEFVKALRAEYDKVGAVG
jgi:hypothetical protein